MKRHLLTVGPTPIRDATIIAMSNPILYHRGIDFQNLFGAVSEGLQYIFQTKQPVLTLTASGTGTMEAAVTNLLSSDDHVLCVNAGKFGARWGMLCRRFSVRVSEIIIPWGSIATLEQINDVLTRTNDITAIFHLHTWKVRLLF